MMEEAEGMGNEEHSKPELYHLLFYILNKKAISPARHSRL